ncbi:uncharacterized protein PF3D7_1120000-like [Procambarus clarkii]|uniref:uncharacterized protein PF3D7_1120000-like n=1 Tax=Procambarus clarkii TaxID=6728 RepID=UPI003743BA9F
MVSHNPQIQKIIEDNLKFQRTISSPSRSQARKILSVSSASRSSTPIPTSMARSSDSTSMDVKTCLKGNLLPVYTNINPHDPAVRNAEFTKSFRQELIRHQLKTKKEALQTLKGQAEHLLNKWTQYDIPNQLKQTINSELFNLKQEHKTRVETKTLRVKERENATRRILDTLDQLECINKAHQSDNHKLKEENTHLITAIHLLEEEDNRKSKNEVQLAKEVIVLLKSQIRQVEEDSRLVKEEIRQVEEYSRLAKEENRKTKNDVNLSEEANRRLMADIRQVEEDSRLVKEEIRLVEEDSRLV